MHVVKSADWRGPQAENVAVLVTCTLAVYLGLVYVGAFSQATGAGRHAIHVAIFAMDALVAALLVRWGIAALAGDPGVGRARGWQGWTAVLVLGAVLAWIVLLHADYVAARIRGAEEGWTGPLLSLKPYLLAGQVGFVLAASLASALRLRRWSTRGPDAADFLLVPLLLVPLANYLARNVELFTVALALEYVAFFLAVPFGAWLVLTFLQRTLGAPAIVTPLVVGLGFVHYSMPWVSSAVRRPIETLFGVHLVLAIVVAGGLTAAYHRNRPATRRTVALFATCSIVASTLHPLLAGEAGDTSHQPRSVRAGTDDDSRDAQVSTVLGQPATRRPDVYLLVYDGYAPASLMRTYGIEDESDVYLEGAGFKTYGQAYSLFLSSKASMGSVMDMSPSPRTGLGGDVAATRFFHSHGYEAHLVLNAYLLQGSAPVAADSVFPPWQRRSGLSTLYRGIAGGEFKAEIVFRDSAPDEWLAAKRSILARPDGPPRMVYAHSPHPGHSQNSGRCLPDETAQYASRLANAREEMRGDIDAVLSTRREAIIIVAGDHGPYLTGDCLYMARQSAAELTATHLADRYGTKLAIRWPEPPPTSVDRVTVLQDVFFAVTAYMLDDDSVWRYRLPAETVGYGGIPHGAVQNGIVSVGQDRGRPLFDATAR